MNDEDLIDLQWFADDDDDNNENENTTEDNKEDSDPHSVPDDIANDFDFSEFGDDAKAGYFDVNGNYLGEDDKAAQEAAKSHNDDSFLTENWSESQDNFGYEINDDGSTKVNWHNAKTAARDVGDKVKGLAENAKNYVNLALGGNRAGYTSADFERQEEAAKARDTYNAKAEQKQAEIDSFKSRMDPNSKADQETLSKLEAERDDYTNRANSISLDINSTDTGSRLGNIVNNKLEDLGDVGTSINQFFGGADQYGLDSKGRINDRDGDGKVSFSERIQNVGRNAGQWLTEQLIDAARSSLVTAAYGINPFLGLTLDKLSDKGIQALQEYAKTHPYTQTEAEKQAGIDFQDTDSDSEDTPVTNSEPAEPTAKLTESKKAFEGGWDTKTLQDMSTSGRTYGWNKSNDVMGHNTSALSDARFKDFALALFTDNESLHRVLKTKMMLDYFN